MSEVLFNLGDLAGSYRARRAATAHAEQYGLGWYQHWASMQEFTELYFTRCDWDTLMARADDVIRETTIMNLPARDFRTRIRVAHDDVAGAVAEAEQMLEFARRAGDPQALQLALPAAGLSALAADEHPQCSEFVDEFFDTMNFTSLVAQSAAPLLGVILHDLGRGSELASRVRGVEARTPWLEAGIASAGGHFANAATIYQRVGDRPDEAYSRLRVAEQLTSLGRTALAHDRLDRALGYFRSVHATAYVRRGESLATTNNAEGVPETALERRPPRRYGQAIVSSGCRQPASSDTPTKGAAGSISERSRAAHAAGVVARCSTFGRVRVAPNAGSTSAHDARPERVVASQQ